uniref:Tetanus toxin n=1 Tax=Lygus hesperus TaxID=30085 RepID=A0A0A9VTC0_LYGHE
MTADVDEMSSLVPHTWVHVCVVMSVVQTMSVFVNGVRVGMCSCPYFPANNEMTIEVAAIDRVMCHDTDTVYGIGDIEIWAEELTSPQVEAQYSYQTLHPPLSRFTQSFESANTHD